MVGLADGKKILVMVWLRMTSPPGSVATARSCARQPVFRRPRRVKEGGARDEVA
jgi:hypothetical protein